MRTLTVILFTIYMIILVKVVLFKGPLFYEVVSGADDYRASTSNATYKGYNLVPFRTIKSFLTPHPSISTSTKVFNLLGNIALFVPFGVLLPLLFRNLGKFNYMFLASVLLSLFFEAFQLFTHTGHFDVDDIILNSLGGVIGYLIFIATSRSLRRKVAVA
jgi:glycopeptide antibiotics resistance protein